MLLVLASQALTDCAMKTSLFFNTQNIPILEDGVTGAVFRDTVLIVAMHGQ